MAGRKRPPQVAQQESDSLDDSYGGDPEGPQTEAEEWRAHPHTDKVADTLKEGIFARVKDLYLYCRDTSVDPAARARAARIDALEIMLGLTGRQPVLFMTEKNKKYLRALEGR